MSNVLPNPKKEVTTNNSISKVAEIIKLLPKHVSSAKLIHENPTMGFYQFEATGNGLFSTGMYIEISLHEITENKTRLVLEGRRKIGWIDVSTEYSETINYMNGTISMIGKGLRGELK